MNKIVIVIFKNVGKAVCCQALPFLLFYTPENRGRKGRMLDKIL